jgi:uncharacterized protein YycO
MNRFSQKVFIIIAILISASAYFAYSIIGNEILNQEELHEGDIIFQISKSGQSKAIQIATHSKYSHCGVLTLVNGKWQVIEASNHVKITALDEWINNGENGKFVIKRLKQSDKILDGEAIHKMKKVGTDFLNTPYDFEFDWSNSKMYCSELVYKIFKNSIDIEIGTLRTLKDFDLSSEIVQETMRSRYGKNIPYNETVISPADIFESEKLETIIEN